MISIQSIERIIMMILLLAMVLVNWFGFAPNEWILLNKNMVVDVLSVMTTLNQTATTNHSKNNSGIPKIIHLIWLTARNLSLSSSSENNSSMTFENDANAESLIPEDGPLPTYLVHNMKRFKELHTDYQIKLWRNKDVLTTFPELTSFVKILTVQKKYLSWLSDILRFAVLSKFGGIYIDADFDILHSLEPLQAGFPNGFTFCLVPTNKKILIHPQDIHLVQDLVVPFHCENVGCQIAAPQEHPALLNAYTKVIRNSNNNLKIVEKGEFPRSAMITGPGMWRNVVHEFNFTVLIHEAYYPCPVSKRHKCNSSNYVNDPYAYAMHRWTASWKANAIEDVFD